MLLIHCPWCGEREETEFHTHGEAHIRRPKDPGNATDEQWGAYLFFRDNLRGWHREQWTHDFGCRRWFYMLRNTATGEIHATYAPDDIKPEPPPASSSPEERSRPPENNEEDKDGDE